MLSDHRVGDHVVTGAMGNENRRIVFINMARTDCAHEGNHRGHFSIRAGDFVIAECGVQRIERPGGHSANADAVGSISYLPAFVLTQRTASQVS